MMGNLREHPGDRLHIDERGHTVKPEVTSDSMAFLSVCPGSVQAG